MVRFSSAAREGRRRLGRWLTKAMEIGHGNHATILASVTAEAGAAEAAVAAPPLIGTLPRPDERTGCRRRDTRGFMLRRLLLAADVAALVSAFFVVETLTGHLRKADLVLLIFSLPIWVIVANAHKLYHLDSMRSDYGLADEVGPILEMATIWSWATLLGLHLLGPGELAVGTVGVFWLATIISLVACRSAVRAWARRRPWYLQNAIIVGPVGQATSILRKILRHPEWGLNVCACIEQQSPQSRFRSHSGMLLDKVPVIRTEDVLMVVQELEVDRVMLAPAASLNRERADLLCVLAERHVHVDLVPSWSDIVGARLSLNEMEGMPLLTVPYANLRHSSLLLKRAFDFVVSFAALVVFAPLYAACAVAIKLDSPGPVLFRQRRVGRDDRIFYVFKFRSMYVDADQRKAEIARLNFHGGGNEIGMFKAKDDPRITRVGRQLRRLSLDELPQLLNILRGDMSLVGPRPLIENEDRQVEGRHRQRLSLAPGLTGLWQANGRSDIPFEEMVSLDYLYVTNWTLWGDMKLLVRTVSAVTRGRGAY